MLHLIASLRRARLPQHVVTAVGTTMEGVSTWRRGGERWRGRYPAWLFGTGRDEQGKQQARQVKRQKGIAAMSDTCDRAHSILSKLHRQTARQPTSRDASPCEALRIILSLNLYNRAPNLFNTQHPTPNPGKNMPSIKKHLTTWPMHEPTNRPLEHPQASCE